MVSIETGSFSFTSPPLSSFECNAMASAHIWNAMELIYYRIELTLIFTILPKNGRKSSLWCIIIITFKLYNSIWVWMSEWVTESEYPWCWQSFNEQRITIRFQFGMIIDMCIIPSSLYLEVGAQSQTCSGLMSWFIGPVATSPGQITKLKSRFWFNCATGSEAMQWDNI